MNTTKYLLFVFVSVFFQSLFAQKITDLSKLQEKFLTQLTSYPQEKIHLHTDRDFYVPGERILFKVYVADAMTNEYPTNSRYVYVELIDSRDSLVSRVMIRPVDDMFYGHLFLSKIIPEGNYTIRAYTRYMENLGDDYFFKKNIRIGNIPSDKKQPSNSKQTSQNKQKNDRTRPSVDDYEVSFFPEGGNLPEGVFCKIAFKALNKNGYPETISGKVIDETGTEIAPITTFHAGMGIFDILPKQDKKYYLKCKNENGLEKQFELPQSNSETYSLTTSWKNNRILVSIKKSFNNSAIPCYLLIHSRGWPLYFSAWNHEKNLMTFPEESFPAGVLQFVLFDENMNPLSERLVFNKNEDDVKVEFQTAKTIYETKDNVVSILTITDFNGNPLTGHLSVAITDDKDISVDNSTTIHSSLLLSSELKGYIENPAWYLQNNDNSATALDYLMMTHGWRRYNIPEVMKGNAEYPKIPYQTSQEITGKITGSRSKPVTGSTISMMTKDGGFGIATSDDKGKFTFHDFEYIDSTSVFFIKGSNNGEIFLDKESFPELIYATQSPPQEISVIEEKTNNEPAGIDAFITKAELRSRYDSAMREIHLSEVVVTASRTVIDPDEPRLQFYANLSSDVTIRRENFISTNRALVSDLLLGVAGVIVHPDGKIFIRGATELPLILINGVSQIWVSAPPGTLLSPWDSPVENVSIEEVESIDIFKSGNTALFGRQGANGVISITTRKGFSDHELKIEKGKEKFKYDAIFTPLGYQSPVEFYSPRYDTLEDKNSNIPDYRTTIFWKPDVVISDTGKSSFDFYTSVFPTTYSVVIEGLTKDGRIIRKIEKIEIK